MAVIEASGSAARGGGERIAAAVTVAAILLFVGTGSAVLGDTVRVLSGIAPEKGATHAAALLLNVALILLAWRWQGAAEHTSTAAERIPQLAARDPSTGVLNRRGLGEEGAALLAAAAKRRKPVALMVLELDHRPGEAMLPAVAAAIEAAMPPSTLIARLEDDSFACALIFEPDAPGTVARAAERLLARLVQPGEGDVAPLPVTAALGIARSDRDGAGIEALLRSAEIAMRAARRTGRNKLAWFDAAMERELQGRAELEHGLRAAIAAEEIVPWFEPQVALADGRVIGFEVLARWQHPRLGIIAPDRFIPLAEANGLIADLSMSVIRQALLAARDWDPSLTVAVNLSPAQLRDAWLAQKLIKLLGETGFPAQRLQVEITERALFDNLPLAQSIVASLKNQGITLALDDFGTGYSSLAHLRAIPFDVIKIDTSFVTSMADSAESAAVVTAIAGLGESLNLPITAEGVETEAVAERLRALGCTKAQGWHFGKPMPVAGVRRLLAEKRMLMAPSEDFRNRRLAG